MVAHRRFDLQAQRAAYQQFTLGFLQGFEPPPGAPAGLAACAQADAFVCCALLGLLAPVAGLIPARLAWLEQALAGSPHAAERSAYQRAEMRQAQALYRWLMGAAGAPPRWAAIWQQARQEHARALDEPGTYRPAQRATLGLDDHLVLCLLAGDFEAGLALYESLRPGRTPVPTRALAPRDWAWLACREALSPTCEPGALQRAGQRMLDRWLQDPWLCSGQSARAATWLLAVHDPPGTRLPPEALMAHAWPA